MFVFRAMASKRYPSSSSAAAAKSIEDILLEVPHKQYENAAEENPVLDQNKAAADFLHRTGLLQYFPKKLGIHDALHIRKTILDLSLSGTPPKSIEEVPFLLLHKLMSYDPKCLTDLKPADAMQRNSPKTKTKDTGFPDSDGGFPDSDEENSEVVSTKVSDTIHPIDCLLALLFCSDDFLSQDLYSRLARCQRAIPLVIPNPFTKQLLLPLWSLQSIIYDWKSTVEGKTSDQTHQVVNYPMPIVTFLRMGTDLKSVSKSKLLNEVISESEQSYNFFFHRNCSGGSYKRVLSEGMVDMFWYFPNGKKTDLFPDAVTFLNLHGDARNYPKQMELLGSMSSICFILVNEKNIEFDSISRSLETLCKCQGGATFLSSKKQEKITKKLSNFSVINLVSKTDFEVKKLVREKLQSNLKQISKVECLSTHVKEKSSVTTNEEVKPYKLGNLHARKIVDHVMNFTGEKSKMKDELLPLQGEDCWRKWADQEKELHRQTFRGKQSVQEYGDVIRGEQSMVRSNQLKHINSLTPITAAFLKELLQLEGPENKQLRNYFLQCLKLELNNLSRQSISRVYEEYHSVRAKLASLVNDDKSKNEEKAEQKETLRTRLKVLGEEIINSSIGLEHLLREVGQIYEAKNDIQSISRLPRSVAELLVDGYPLELMDGDAAHVPLQWVAAVLNEAAKILGDPQVFVISVLGIQSTGKSTMMNTTFGVQFNVSAGRCTRGAYMQLLPVDEEIKKATNCSYVLIVDTEGLRALELDPQKTQKHDNELATFVIGLANVTLINIYGEVPGEMDNILQTAVHAFLRMKKIKYRPSCHFVHQNASENAKSEVGREHFMAKLNNFTKIAAEEESWQYDCFNDVIEFDDQTDVHHFPGLWRGDPPMAPVNQGYSTAAQQLKHDIIQCICSRAGQSDLSLSAFQQRMKDLWSALLNETFIFSFKNTLEIRAYKKMEEVYSEWQWKFTKTLSEWEHKAKNLINSEPETTVPNLKARLKKELQELIEEKHSRYKETMEQHFRGKDSDILKDWKGYFEKKLQMLAEKLEQHAKTHCENLFNSKMELTKFSKDKQQAKQSAGYIKDIVLEDCKQLKLKQEKLLECIKNKQLDSHQLEELLKLDLFSNEKLRMYGRDKIIRSDQIRAIQQMKHYGMSAGTLSRILTGETLAFLDVQKILMLQEPESELKKKFEDIWENQTRHLHGVVDRYVIEVEREMENALTNFDMDNKGKLQEKLRQRRLSKRRDKQFTPNRKQHYTDEGGVIKNFLTFNLSGLYHAVANKVTGAVNTCPENAEKVTRGVLEVVYSKLDEITENETDSIEACTIMLLGHLRAEIKTQSEEIKKCLTFKPEYEIELQLMACSHALPTFEAMADKAREKMDPLYYLEKYEKAPLFTTFKNLHLHTKTENSIADTVCAYLEEPIKTRLEQSLPLILANTMRQSKHHYFSSKMALKVLVLTDLYKEGQFKDYMSYAHYPGQCLENYLVKYIAKFCDSRSKPGATQLQVIVEKEVGRIINVVVTIINVVVTEMKEIQFRKAITWLTGLQYNEVICENTVVKQTVSDILKTGKSSHEFDLKKFPDTIKSSLTLKKVSEEDVGKVIDVVVKEMKTVKNQSACDWLKELLKHEAIREELVVKQTVDEILRACNPSHELDLETFPDTMASSLLKLKDSLQQSHIQARDKKENWKKVAQNHLKDLVGCKERCPFCFEQCDLQIPNHQEKHRVEVHRIGCVGGGHYHKTNVLTLTYCPNNIADDRNFIKKDGSSHPYRKYADIYPNWAIPSDKSAESLYWKLFVGKHIDELVKYHDKIKPTIDSSWKYISWSKVEEDLKRIHHL